MAGGRPASGAAPGLTLVLLRHAEAAAAGPRGPSGADADLARPLTPRGRAQARAAAEWLRAAGAGAVDLVLVSPALRTAQTWAELAEVLHPGTVREEPSLYDAPALGLVHLLAALPEEVRSVLVVAHEPAVSAAAVALAGSGSDGAALARVRAGAAPASASVLAHPGPWAGVTGGSCVLRSHAAPSAG